MPCAREFFKINFVIIKIDICKKDRYFEFCKYIYIYMYVCIYICMYVCMYVWGWGGLITCPTYSVSRIYTWADGCSLKFKRTRFTPASSCLFLTAY